MKNKILMLHQGAELYGSDKMFNLTVDAISKENHVDVILDSSGPLIDELKKTNVCNVNIKKLAVLRRVNFRGVLSAIGFILCFINTLITLVNIQRKNGYDIIYVNTLAVICPLFLKVFFPKLKVIHHLHEIQENPRIMFRVLYSVSFAFSDLILSVSKAVKENALSMNMFTSKNNKIKVIYNGINKVGGDFIHERLTNDDIKNHTIIAMVGRIHHWKGQIDLLDILHDLRCNYDLKFKVVFAGGVFPGYEDLLEDFRAKVQNLNLASNVIELGEIPDASRIFTISDMSLMPSTLPDPLPTVVLESMSCGCPVVSYSHGGALEMIVHNETGLLVDVGDKASFAQSILSISTNSALKEKFKEKSLQRFENKFSVGRYYDDIKKAFCL